MHEPRPRRPTGLFLPDAFSQARLTGRQGWAGRIEHASSWVTASTTRGSSPAQTNPEPGVRAATAVLCFGGPLLFPAISPAILAATYNWLGADRVRIFRQQIAERAYYQSLAATDEAIRNSKSLLDLPADWDDQGSPPVSPIAWKRATALLRRHAVASVRIGIPLDVPRIDPGPDGSIDLHWIAPTFELLINVPGQERCGAGFYGDDRRSVKIKGSLDPDVLNHWLVQWIAERKR
jgi:hypothetical protein